VVKNPPLRSDNDLRGSDRARQDATRTIVQETHHVLRESREFKQCVLVSHSRDSQQRHCALRTRCIRQLELRRSWQPRRNFLFNLRPSRRDEGHFLSKYSGRPNRSFWTHLLMLWRVKRFIGRFQPRGTAVQAVYRFHCSTPIRLYTVYTSRIWARDSELPGQASPKKTYPNSFLAAAILISWGIAPVRSLLLFQQLLRKWQRRPAPVAFVPHRTICWRRPCLRILPTPRQVPRVPPREEIASIEANSPKLTPG